jgi:hypothetical protein
MRASREFHEQERRAAAENATDAPAPAEVS